MPFLAPLAVPLIGSAIGGIAGAIGGHHGGGSKSTGGLEQNFLDLMNQEEGQKEGLVKQNKPTLDFFSGDPTKSPLYKANLSMDRENTASTYDSAISNSREGAAARGFGFTSPLAFGAEEGLRARETGDLAKAPSRALLSTVQPELTAAGIRAGEAGAFNPNSLAGDVAGLNEAEQKRKGDLFSSLFNLAGTIGGPLIDHMGDFGGGGTPRTAGS